MTSTRPQQKPKRSPARPGWLSLKEYKRQQQAALDAARKAAGG